MQKAKLIKIPFNVNFNYLTIIRDFLASHMPAATSVSEGAAKCRVLFSGPCESTQPGIQEAVKKILLGVFV